MRPWIQVMADIFGHPKTETAADALGISECEMVGILTHFWTKAVIRADDKGHMTAAKCKACLHGLVWSKARHTKAEEIIAAMLNCGDEKNPGFLDRTAAGGYAIHNWHKYTGGRVAAYNTQRARKARWKRAHGLVQQFEQGLDDEPEQEAPPEMEVCEKELGEESPI